MKGRTRGAVQIDRYALENVMMARETNACEVSEKIGRSRAYLSQVFKAGGYMKPSDFENLKGLLRVTDSDIKAIPIQRSEAVESIYQPVPVAKSAIRTVVLTEDVDNVITSLASICGVDKTKLVNGIITEYLDGSDLVKELRSAIDAVKGLAG